MSDIAEGIEGPAGTTVLPPARRWPVTFVVIGAMVMVVLDTTIANVAIPHMQASLGATSESVAWVLTSYIVATAIAIPITGWLSDRIGRRLLFTIALAGFTLSSMLCGVAQSLSMMIASRVLQGIFGAFIGPLSQATIYDINPPEKHAQAMSIWGMAVMLAPVCGPMVGGWLTEQYSWRWCFYINVPIGIAAAIGAFTLIPDWRGATRRFDLLGFLLLAVALGALQLLLDRGTQLDWFDSTEIWIETALAVGAGWMLVIRAMSGADTIIPAAIFTDRNYITSILFVMVIGAILMAGATLVAPMLQRLMGYPVFQAGMTIAPRGFGTLMGFLVAGRVIHRVDARLMVAVGMTLIAASLHMMTGFDLAMDSWPVLTTGLLQGVGTGLVMMPMSLLAFATLPPALRTEGASFYNLARNVGGSIAISVTTALLASNLQTNHAELGGRLSMPLLSTGIAESAGFDSHRLWAVLDAEVNRQSAMIAYLDDYWLMMWLTIVAVPTVLLMSRPKSHRGAIHIGE